MNWNKVRLENMIFYYAAQEGKEVWARNGFLVVVDASAILKVFLQTYNRFFAEENRKFLSSVHRQELRYCRYRYSLFKQETIRRPLKRLAGMDCYVKK